MDQNTPVAAPEGQVPQQAGETQAQTQARMYKVMVDGFEHEVDEATLTKGYSHGKAADARIRQAAAAQKEIREVMHMMKNDPMAAMRKLGMDPDQFINNYYSGQLEELGMSDDQRELRKARGELSRIQQLEQQAREEQDREIMEAEQARYTHEIQQQMKSALDVAGLPMTSQTVQRIAYYIQSMAERGYKANPIDVVGEVRNDYLHEVKVMMTSISDDQLEAFLGKDVINKIAKSTIKQSKAVIQSAPKSVNKDVKPRGKEARTSTKDFFKRPNR